MGDDLFMYGVIAISAGFGLLWLRAKVRRITGMGERESVPDLED